MTPIEYRVRPELTSAELNGLLSHVWDDHDVTDLSNVLTHSLTYVCAYADGELFGFVDVAWDAGQHAFLLDAAVHRDMRRGGIGPKLVEYAMDDTRTRGLKWLRVDFEPHLEGFYRDCGFRDTASGLIRLND